MKCLELSQLDKYRIAPYTQRVFLPPIMAAELHLCIYS